VDWLSFRLVERLVAVDTDVVFAVDFDTTWGASAVL